MEFTHKKPVFNYCQIRGYFRLFSQWNRVVPNKEETPLFSHGDKNGSESGDSATQIARSPSSSFELTGLLFLNGIVHPLTLKPGDKLPKKRKLPNFSTEAGHVAFCVAKSTVSKHVLCSATKWGAIFIGIKLKSAQFDFSKFKFARNYFKRIISARSF